jgi:hypothetical protein
MLIEIVTKSKTYHIYKTVLLTIKVAARNTSGRQLVVFPQYNTTKLDV